MSRTIRVALIVVILGLAALFADNRFGTFGGSVSSLAPFASGWAVFEPNGERVVPAPSGDGVATSAGGTPDG